MFNLLGILLHFIYFITGESNLFYIERNVATTWPFMSKLSGKFQRFNAIEGSCQNAEKSWISKSFNKMKNCKTFYEAQTSSCFKEIIQDPPLPLRSLIKPLSIR